MTTAFTDIRQYIRLTAAAFLMLYSTPPALAQQGTNYVRVTEHLDAVGSQTRSTTTYYNGMGWPVETVQSGYNPQGTDIATLTEYDLNGRAVRQWERTAVSGYSQGGWIPPAAIRSAGASGARYTNIEYDGSPLNRETKRTGPGNVWKGRNKGVSTQYLTNTSANQIQKYALEGDNSIRKAVGWPGGMFHVTRNTDEDQRVTVTFTDMHGRLALERHETPNGNYDTYYIYDPLGRLRYVLPPAATAALDGMASGTTVNPVENAALSPYIYAYRYDDRGNCTWKKLPGREYEEMMYDKDGCLAYHRDGNARAAGRWYFHLHDRFLRETVTGTVTGVDTTYRTRSFRAIWAGSSGQLGGYRAEFNMPGARLLTVTYYDNYDFLNNTAPHVSDSARFEKNELDTVCGNAKGHVTGMRAYNTSEDSTAYSLHSIYYDGRGRLLQERVSHSLGGYSRDFYHYTFDGRQSWRRHRDTTRLGKRMTVDQTYLYDSHGLPTAVYCHVNGKPVRLTATYTQDALGRPATENLGQTETVAYTYNERSWPATISSPRFSEHLSYALTEGQATVQTSRFSGDLSAVAWKAGGGSGEPWRRYALTYDTRGRLTDASYAEGGAAYSDGANHYGESFTYDIMGNVTQIERRGMQDDDTFSPIDDLILTYDGNQLTHVEEYAEEEPATKGSMHFSQAAGSSAQYAWDANGNMTKDRNRGIESISYDARNNPLRVTFEDGTYTDYTYDATGRKLRSAHPPIMGHPLLDPITVNGGAVTQGAGNEINGGGLHDPGGPGGGIVGPIVPSYQGDTIDYCGNTVVVNGEVSRVAHDKGYITFDDAGDPLFHYYLRDHLGSVRVVFNEEDSTEQVNHYYASGALMDTSTGSAEQPLKYNGKELLREWGIEAYDYGARWMLPVTGPMFTQIDPLCEKYYDTSPYSYCKGNFMNAIDPDGRNPIYDLKGNFLGTDNTGIRGNYFVMDRKNFTQGMSHIEAGNLAVLGAIPGNIESKINQHFDNLPNRPDYDGFVTILEGVVWAKMHPNALKNPTPDNTLYIDTSQLDFGSISTYDFPKVNVSKDQNLFNGKNLFESFVNMELAATVYALGRVNMILRDRSLGTVEIVNDKATDYDWNTGGDFWRELFIRTNNLLLGINPEIHGFKTFYYGIGRLRE